MFLVLISPDAATLVRKYEKLTEKKDGPSETAITLNSANVKAGEISSMRRRVKDATYMGTWKLTR